MSKLSSQEAALALSIQKLADTAKKQQEQITQLFGAMTAVGKILGGVVQQIEKGRETNADSLDDN